MGICIVSWRQRIGSFSSILCTKRSVNAGSCCRVSGYSVLSSCVIALLLLCAGIEPNPGPTVAELARKLDEFIAAYDVTYDQLHLSIPALAIRLDEEIKNLRSLLSTVDATLLQLGARISTIESRAPQPKGEIPAVVNNAQSPRNRSVTNSGEYSPQSIENLVNSALDKDKRKCNIIIFNLSDTDSFQDDKYKLSRLFRDLRLHDSCIQSITRFGRSNRDRPLKVTLSSKWHRDCLLDSAFRLASIRSKWPKLSIAPDRTYEEMSAHRQLVLELRRRRDLGENVRLRGDIIVHGDNLNNNRNQPSTYVSKTSAPNSPLLPLQVNLPPLLPSLPLQVDLTPILQSTSLCQPLSVTAPSFTPNTDNCNK